MNFSRSSWRFAPLFLAGLALVGGGCSNPFIAKYKVLVDAIAAPEAVKPAGQSYRLVAKPSVVSRTPVQMPVIAACINVALGGQGMFEAPENVAPDIFLEVSFGNDASPRIDPATRETFLQLSARANPEKSMTRPTGPEVWDVRVAVIGLSPGNPIEGAMPLLCSVAVNYLATDTRLETSVEVPQKSPSIIGIRDGAIKTLEAKYPGTPPPTPAPLPAIPAGLPPPTPK
jgi:hypothetical protein